MLRLRLIESETCCKACVRGIQASGVGQSRSPSSEALPIEVLEGPDHQGLAARGLRGAAAPSRSECLAFARAKECVWARALTHVHTPGNTADTRPSLPRASQIGVVQGSPLGLEKSVSTSGTVYSKYDTLRHIKACRRQFLTLGRVF